MNEVERQAKKQPAQFLQNLPQEILALPRFLRTRKDNPKAPVARNWQNPKNQHLYSELKGTLGFVAATDTDDSLIFFDFDHVLDDNSNFVSEDAERWFNLITDNGKYFSERSQSRRGLHSLAEPTKGKFGKVTGKIYLTADKKSFIEVFYKTNKNCLVTGSVFRCAPQSPIAQGETADIIFQAVIDEIARQNQSKNSGEPKLIYDSTQDDLGTDYDIFRAQIMLDDINPAELVDEDWLAVISAAKNIGIGYAVIDAFSRKDPDRYKEGENKTRYDSLHDPSYNIATLHGIAKRFGYSEKDTRRKWFELYPDSAPCKSNADKLQSAKSLDSNTDAELFGISDSTSPKAKRQERSDRMENLMTTREVADELNVSPKTVENWRTRKLFGCYFFSADEKHGDTLYYYRERVMQLKAVYQKGVLQNMYKLARKNPEPYTPTFFSETSFNPVANNFDEELSFRHKDFLILEEVADFFDVSVSTVKSWVHRGILKEDMLGHNGDLYFAIDNILEFTPPKGKKNSAQGEEKIKTCDVIKDCPADLLLPDNFKFGRDGITLIVPPKKDGDNPKYICAARTPIIPTKIFREPTKNKFSYEIAILIRGVWRTTEIDGRILADPRAIITLADTGALIDEPKILCRFLNSVISLNPDLPEIKAYNRTGWTDDTFTAFAYTGIENLRLRRAGFDFDKTLAENGSAEEWKEKFRALCEKGAFCGKDDVREKSAAIVAMCIGTVLVAPLARPLNILNPQCHLLGTSGGGKTALQKFAASIYGNPRKLIRTFAATNKNRQLVADAFCDLPTFLDELETVQGKFAEEQLSNDIYNFAEGKGNQANKRNGDARETFEFGGARLTTGERQHLKNNDLRGAFKRLIQLDTQGYFLEDSFAAELHIFSESNFGHYGLPWIQFVTEHMAELKKEYQNHASRREPTIVPYEPTHLKQVCASLVAFEFFKVMTGITEKFDSTSFVQKYRVIVDSLPTLAEIDDTVRALESLRSYCGSHERLFTRDVINPNTNAPFDVSAWGGVCLGKIFDTGAVAFFPNELKRILEDELKFASADKLINAWIQDGTIIPDAGRKTKVIKIGKKTYRAYYFKAGVLSSSNDSAESDYYEKLSEM